MSKPLRSEGLTAGWSDEAIRAVFGGTALYKAFPNAIPDPRIMAALLRGVEAAFALEEAVVDGKTVKRCQARLFVALQDLRELRVRIAAERAQVAEIERESSRRLTKP